MDFFQRTPPFLIQLQNILRKYPDGGQILKELIQNADDAKAREVIFVYDERTYGTDTLYSKDLHIIQGPALFAYNNEEFSDKDWEGIQKPGNSIKRKDPDTVGRFGLGFNSVYHITDFPAVFSGKNIGFLDPQEKIFHRGGCLWNIKEGGSCLQELSDQFQPFQKVLEALDVSSWEKILNSGHFNGTLFRFPLRLTPSEISENIYNSERVQELFECFIKDAGISLLFLRHVTSVSLKKIDKDGVLTPLLSISVSMKDTFDSESIDLGFKTYLKQTTLKSFGKDNDECQWLVTTTAVPEGHFPDLTEIGKKLCNKPTLDVAFPLSQLSMDLYAGRLCCVLPLPDKQENRTGLPLVINGCFELTDDRRSLKLIETDQQNDEAAKWNHIILEKILPLLYVQAINNAVSFVKQSKFSVSVSYSLWPDPEITQHKEIWHKFTKKLALSLINESILQTAGPSRWINVREAIFLLPENADYCIHVEELLLFLKVPVVKVPRNVYATINLVTRPKVVSPSLVRQILCSNGWDHFPREKKLSLLKYCISDGQYNELLNLQLLPLADGTFTRFQNTETNGMVYIDNEDFPRLLLPGLAHRFIPEELPDDLRAFLTKIGKSGTFKNLVCLDKDLVRQKLSKALPQKWHESPDRVTWHPQNRDNPPVQWIFTLWKFLQRYNVLEAFENQPIVPLNLVTERSANIQLARLKKNSMLLLHHDSHSLDDCLSVLLEKAGCTVIRQPNSWLWHKNMDIYILVPTPNNILKTFEHLKLTQIIKVLMDSPGEHIKLFCELLSRAYSFNSSELVFASKLPIFSSAPCISAPVSKRVPADRLAAVRKDLVPAIPDDLIFPEILIQCRDESDQRLLQLMQIRLLNAADLALLIVKGIQDGTYAAHRDAADNAMLWILRNAHMLFTQNDLLKSVCRDLQFIQCNGTFKKPSDFFDPTVNILKDLFESDKFPPSNYNEDSVLTSLRQLGLQDSIHKIKPHDVLQIAEAISQNGGSAMKKANALITVCNKTNVLSHFTKHDLEKLCSTSWVPNVNAHLQTVFQKPKDLRNITYHVLVEFSMPFTNAFNENANTILGLNHCPPPERVVKNLKILSLKYTEMDLYFLNRKLQEIYKYMLDHINQFSDQLLSEVMIWNGEGFSCPNAIVLFYPEGLDLSASTKKVPPAYIIYQHLFTQCGVKKTLADEEVVKLLHIMKQRVDSVFSDAGSYKDLKLAILILDWMKANSVHVAEDLPVPVKHVHKGFSLQPLSKSLFCDLDKQHLSSSSVSYPDCYILHEEISLATAQFLKVQFLSTKILKPELFEAWGPTEPVTLRIKNILREYSEHLEVFKEIVQNADDADATVCRFLVDMRENLDVQKSLIDPGMASCHGPALWSYNNSKFKDEDFVNITRIGAATKEAQADKIGKFGLGFNTVYHITDVPTIISGSTILMFDPNVTHLQKHIPSNNPGIKLDLQKNSETLCAFPDQFQPFIDVFGCKFTHPFYFNGTLIRLPFRTTEEANSSKICQQSFSEEHIKMLMNDFEDFADTLLIFLKHIKEVELNYINPASCPEQQVTKVHIQKDHVQSLPMPKEAPLQKEQIYANEILEMPVEIFDITTSNIINITVEKTGKKYSKCYFAQSSLGVSESFEMYIQETLMKKQVFSLPVAGIALPLKRNERTGKWTPDLKDFQGMVFCYLPLPMTSGLPFHINGTFAVMSNRKNLWDTTVKGEWNKQLLCDALLVALLTALSQMQVLLKNGDLQDYFYYTFWPDITKTTTAFTKAVRGFYHAITFGFGNELPALFCNGLECCTIKQACFLEIDGIHDEAIKKIANKVFSSMLKTPYQAVSLPDWVRKSFIASSCFKEVEKNIFNIERFFREIVFDNISALKAEDRNALVLYAIDLQNKELDRILISKPCIPSSSGTLQFIGKLVHPNGKLSALYEPEEGRFPQGKEFLKWERLVRLQMLGMLVDRLPVKDLLDRANRIKEVWSIDRPKALKRIAYILELLNDILQQDPEVVNAELFRDLKFLPAVPPQNHCNPSKDLILLESKKLFHYKHEALVCMVNAVLSKEHLESIKLTKPLLSILGLDQTPHFQTVLSQLEEACKAQDVLKPQVLFQIAKQCYNYFNTEIQKFPRHADTVKKMASSIPFVYADKRFLPLNVVARNVPFDAAPYLHKLPKEYEQFGHLWACIGLHEEFSLQYYFSILKQIAIKKGGMPLTAHEITLVLNLINHGLETMTHPGTQDEFDAQDIFLPDNQGVLRQIDGIYYNDTPWLPCEEDLHFCHERIPRAVVSKFGIKTKIHHTLQKLKIGNLCNWVSQFGAKEQLCTRIKNIIKEYSSKKDILKELIQNADDCEATEIHFVLDSREHATKHTFGPEWHPVQGPALCVFNNKKFEPKDIEGIQQLGIGGKEDRLDKTGKFGLGFNSVYHISDCPSFVTGDTMCIFDPNLLFLESSEYSSPGGMFSINDKFKTMFKDVYDTFLPTKFNLQEGTLFRLPLRMANTVSMSKISDQTTSLEDIRCLCQELDKDADTMMLFLNNLRKITFSEITSNGQLTKILSVECKIISQHQELLSFQKTLSKLAENHDLLSKALPLQIYYCVGISRSNSSFVNTWHIVRQIGIDGTDMDNLQKLRDISDSLHKKLLPSGAIAACFKQPDEGKAFCTLPLPLKTGLPVHINANFIVDSARRGICFEDGNSPKTDWNIFLLSKFIAPLYCYLLKCLCETLSKLKGEPLIVPTTSELYLNTYLNLFPKLTESVPPKWQILVKEVYLTIFEKKMEVIPLFKESKLNKEKIVKVFVKWSCIGKNNITEEPIFISHENYKNFGRILHDLNMQLAFGGLQNFLHKEFKSANVPILEFDPQTLCSFLKEAKLLPEGQTLPIPVNVTLLGDEGRCNRLLQYCLSKKEIDMQGVPLLVTVDGMLHTIDKKETRFSSRFYGLFSGQSSQFVKYQEYHDSLIKNGFMKQLTIANSVCLVKNHLGPLHDFSSTKRNDLTLSNEKAQWLKRLWEFFHYELVQQKDQMEDVFKTIVYLYFDCAILPVSFGKEKKICSFTNSKIIIPPSSNELDKYLLKLGFASLESHIFTFDTLGCLKHHLLDTNNVELVLVQLCSKGDLHWDSLTDLDRALFLRCISSKLQMLQKQRNITMLQSLPLFETHDGKWQGINGYQRKYVFISNFNLDSLQLAKIDPQTVFLKDTSLNEGANRILGISKINDLELLTNFLIPNLELLNESQLCNVLMLILNLQYCNADFQRVKGHIFSSLRPIKLIRSKQGSLQQPSYFYDKTVQLFQTFGLQEYFVPDKVWKMFGNFKVPFYKLLCELGMKHFVTKEDLIKFATEVERESKESSSRHDLTLKSESLFEYLLSMNVDELGDDFPSVIGKISFVVPLDVQKDLQDLHPSFTAKVRSIALQGSLLERGSYESLVWTSMPLIAKDIHRKEKLQFLEKCGVLFEPCIQHVIENVQNVCMAKCDTIHLKEIRSKVLKLAYEFLQNHICDLDPNFLKNVPFILTDDDDIVESRQVLSKLENHGIFHPYLYQLPRSLVRYSDLFQKVGVEAEASIFHFSKVLLTIHEETFPKMSLHANLKKTVSETTMQLFNVLKNKKPNDIQNLKPLYLPATDGKLYESSNLVFNNRCKTTKEMDEVFKFVRLNQDMYTAENLLKLLPENICPRLLTDITMEIINNFQQCTLGESCPTLNTLTEQLLSPVFHEGLVCLLRNQTKGKVSQEDGEQICRKIFGKIEITCCCKLQTNLMYENETLKGTNMRRPVFVEKCDDNCCKIYLEHTELLQGGMFLRVLHSLSSQINTLTGNIFTHGSLNIVAEMLACDNPNDIIEVLKDHDIWSNLIDSNHEFSMPNPGEKIDCEWYDYLDMNILNTFQVGDYVGYMIPATDEVYVYAEILDKLDAKVFGSCEVPMFRINIGQNDSVDVSVLDIYQFKRFANQNIKHLLPLTNPNQPQQHFEKWFESSLEKILADIDEYLGKIWHLPQDEKIKAIRRLYLKYHPDKNTGQEKLSTKVFQYILEKVKELEAGGRTGNTREANYSSTNSSFSTFWSKWDREASYHKKNYFSRQARNNNFSRQARNNNFGYFNSRPQPNPQEAERWLKQAECDLKAAENDTGTHTEWVFYKVHQAVEKALFAAQYFKMGRIDQNMDLVFLAEKVSTYCSSLQCIDNEVLKMKQYGVDKQKTQYPKYHKPPQIPNNAFPSSKVREVLAVAGQVLGRIKSYVCT